MTKQKQNSDASPQQRTGRSPLFSDKTVGNRLYLQVADSLAQLIMTNNLTEDDRLPPERELAQVYEVSRQTIREALIALEVLNLVKIKPGSGVYVSSKTDVMPALTLPEPPGYLEIVEGLSHFYGEATLLAGQRASNEELLTFRAYVAKIDELANQLQLTEIPKWLNKIHQLIAEASRNMIIQQTCQWLWQLHELTQDNSKHAELEQQADAIPNTQSDNRQTAGMLTDLIANDKDRQKIINSYRSIYELMSRRDAEGAKQTMHNLLQYLTESRALS